MRRRLFRIASWAALAGGVFIAAAAVSVAVIGALALTGRVTYPVNYQLGPFSLRSAISMPVAIQAEVCQSANILKQKRPRRCFRYFVHNDDRNGSDPIRTQDAEVRPTSATLTGTVEFASQGGWSRLVAVSVTRAAVGLLLISGILLMLWRLLAAAADGDVFSPRAVRWLRGIAVLVIAGGVVGPLMDLWITKLGYSTEAFGEAPNLEPSGPSGVDLSQIALGGLVLLVAEVLRYGAKLEAERKLTI